MTALENKLQRTISLSSYLRYKYGSSDATAKKIARPCPLPGHKEVAGKAFVYSDDSLNWRCYGKCKRGGNVVDLHMAANNINSREEAINSLCSVFSISESAEGFHIDARRLIDPADVEKRKTYRSRVSNANDIIDWLLLDYIMSFSVSEEERDTLKASVDLRYKEEGFFHEECIDCGN